MSTTMAARILNLIQGTLNSVKANITSSPFSCLDIFLLCVSTASFVADIGTDAIVIVQYYVKQHYMWMMLTMSLVCFPSLLIQIFSIRWHIVDGDNSNFMWVIHILQLGVFHRYIKLFKVGLQVRKSKSITELSKFNQQQSDICMLRLFESFMESAPQLVLQLYIMVTLEDWSLWTGVSAVASVFSLSWGIAAYSKTMRNVRPEKNHLSWYGLIFQALWRIGSVSARIISMVLFAVAYGPYLLLVMFLHWLCMTVWVITQNTDFCNTWWEERMYNGIVGTIYCFCFFNLKEGHSRWRMAAFYSLTSFQNIGFVLVYYFSTEAKPNQSEIAIVLVFVGMIVGLISMLLYYRFFHPSGSISLCNGKMLKKTMDQTENKLCTENCSTLKTSRKPNPSFSSQELSTRDQLLHDEEAGAYTPEANNANISVLSGQSRLGCQSDLHRSHSLNCSIDDYDTDSHFAPAYYKRKRFLSKSEANHFRTVNYNFRSAVVFGELKTAFHCSCLVLVHDHYNKFLCDSLYTLQPSTSLPNLVPHEPRVRSPVLHFLSDNVDSDEYSTSPESSQSASDTNHVKVLHLPVTQYSDGYSVSVHSPPTVSDERHSQQPDIHASVEFNQDPVSHISSGTDNSDEYSVSIYQSSTTSDGSHRGQALNLSSGSDNSDDCSVSVRPSPTSDEGYAESDVRVSAHLGCNKITSHQDLEHLVSGQHIESSPDEGQVHSETCTCANLGIDQVNAVSSIPRCTEVYKIDDVTIDFSNSNFKKLHESPTIFPHHVMKLSISY